MIKSKSFNQQFKDFCNDWLLYAKQAKKEDYKSYQIFLEETQRAFTKLYVGSKMPEAVSLIEAILKTTTCELIGNNIKYKGNNTIC